MSATLPRTTEESRAAFEFIEEAYRLYHALRQVDEQLHGGDGLGETERETLFKLFSEGPLTVPQLARRRSLTRQRMQQVVNSLGAGELVQRVPNPDHETSDLVVLSAAGRRRVRAMLRRERRHFGRLPVPPARLRSATRAMLAVRRAMGFDPYGEPERRMR